MSRSIVSLATACLAASLLPNLSAAAPTPPSEWVVVGSKALPTAQFAQMRGEYRLTDGRQLNVEGPRTRPMVALDDRAPVALLPAGADRFVSADGSFQLAFLQRPNGLVDSVAVTMRAGAH
jgi:hypothetical protein